MNNMIVEETKRDYVVGVNDDYDNDAERQKQQQEKQNHYCLVCYTDFNHSSSNTTNNNNSNSNSNNNNSHSRNTTNCIRVFLPCDHNDICSLCHLRLRYLHSDKRCPICKQIHEQIVCDNRHGSNNYHKKFIDYPIWGDSLGSQYIYNAEVGMFFPSKYYQTIILPLFGFYCHIPNCPYSNNNNNNINNNNNNNIISNDEYKQQNNNNSSRYQMQLPSPEQQVISYQRAASGNSRDDNNNDDNDDDNNSTNNFMQQQPTSSSSSNVELKQLRALQDHLRIQHKLAVCNLCVENKRDFVARLPRFSPSGLKRHLTVGDGKSFKGHPACNFCLYSKTPGKNGRFYDLTSLHGHLQQEHYKCHVCELHLNMPNQYYRDYTSLERHFDSKHYICRDVQCLLARFVVFANELDLRHHERQVHGATSTSSSTGGTKIQLQFRVRGSQSHHHIDSSVVAPDDSEFNYNLDGQAFVPPSLPSQQQQQQQSNSFHNNNNNNNNDNSDAGNNSLHPFHVQRTEELRQQAESIRRAQQQEEDAFPSLLESVYGGQGSGATGTGTQSLSSNPSNRLTFGWTSSPTVPVRINGIATSNSNNNDVNAPSRIVTAITRQHQRNRAAGVVTEEEFPALIAPASSNNNKKQPLVLEKLSSKKVPTKPMTVSSATAAASVSQHQQIPPISSSYSSLMTLPSSSSSSTYTRDTNILSSTNMIDYPSRRPVDVPSMSNEQEFPSLRVGGKKNSSRSSTTNGTTPRLYAAAEAFAKKPNNISSIVPTAPSGNTNGMKNNTSQSNSSNSSNTMGINQLTSEDFPTLSIAGKKNKSSAAAAALAAKKPPPGFNNFPGTVQNNVPAGTTSTPTVDEIKGILGQSKYKKLKQHTKDFGSGDIDPDTYVELCASLFDTGYTDVNFWLIVPSLIESCPHVTSRSAAQRYLTQVLEQNSYAQYAQEQAVFKVSSSTKSTEYLDTTTSSGWNTTSSSSSSALTKLKTPPPPVTTTSQQSLGRYIPPPTQQQSITKFSVGPKKGPATNAWGTGPAPIIRRSKVSSSIIQPNLAATAAQPQNQSATRFMAKQAKEEKWKQQQSSTTTGVVGIKKKKNNELRDLAFGHK